MKTGKMCRNCFTPVEWNRPLLTNGEGKYYCYMCKQVLHDTGTIDLGPEARLVN